MNRIMQIGGIWLTATFILSLIAGAWGGAPDFIKFVAANRAFFTGVGVGIIVAGFTKNWKIILIMVFIAFVILRLMGL